MRFKPSTQRIVYEHVKQINSFILIKSSTTMNVLAQFKTVLLISLLVLFFTACQNDDEETITFTTNDEAVIVDNTTSEVLFDDAFSLGVALGESRSTEIDSGRPGEFTTKDGDEETFGPCATITFQNVEGVKTVTIDFGEEGCISFGGKKRTGKVIITFTARHFIPGSIITTTFENYTVNDIAVEGTKTVTNTTPQGGPISHSIVVDGAKLTFPNGTTVEWESDRTRTWSAGANTPFNPTDDVYTVGGTHSGKTRNNITYSMSTAAAAPLEYKFSCLVQGFDTPSSGIVDVETSNRPDYTVNFGEGTCDDTYTVTINGVTIVING